MFTAGFDSKNDKAIASGRCGLDAVNNTWWRGNWWRLTPPAVPFASARVLDRQ